MSSAKHTIVIGAGIAGLAIAIRMAVRGHRVTVFEANDYPGGKLTAFEQNGYRFDAGPSLFTLPHLVDELFLLAGKTPTDHFEYRRLEESCRYFWEDGSRLTGWSNAGRFAAEAEAQLGEPQANTLAHLDRAKLIHDSTAKIFMEKSLHKAETWLSSDVLKALAHIPKLGLFKSMNAANESRISTPKLVQLFNRYATYNGSNPYTAPGILNVIPHLEMGVGTFLPKGGMHRITQSLYALAQELGVTFEFGSKVERIVVENKRCTGVMVNGTLHPADLVVSNMDVVPTYRKLMPNQVAPEKTLAAERSSSALIFYWGVQREFPELGLHNILFTEDYADEFRHLFERHTMGDDPTVYINITSKFEKGDAPAGCENWFVMVNAPHHRGQLDEKEIARVRQLVIAKVSRILGQDIAPLIATENRLTPADIEQRTSSHLGALYGAASNDRMAAFVRHPNFSRKIRNLYFCGGSAHPGGGIPLCLLSARIVDELVPNH